MISMIMATTSAVNVANNEKKDTGITIDSKSKTISYKITWNANGGKIGSKKTVITTVKKGSKINKLPASPKLAGYSFVGWYTKKSIGKKISKDTKPNKKVTYYGQWKKILTYEEKKLVGTYGYTNLASGFLSTWSDSYNVYQQWNKGAGTISQLNLNKMELMRATLYILVKIDFIYALGIGKSLKR